MARREIEAHLEAEERLRQSILSGIGYEGKEADLDRVRRKRLELGEARRDPPTKPPITGDSLRYKERLAKLEKDSASRTTRATLDDGTEIVIRSGELLEALESVLDDELEESPLVEKLCYLSPESPADLREVAELFEALRGAD